MQTSTRTIQMPKVLFDYWKPQKVAEKKITQAAIFELLREEKISTGIAAELLGLSKWDFIELASKNGIPAINFSLDEFEQQIKNLKSIEDKLQNNG